MTFRPLRLSTLAITLCALISPISISPAQTPPATYQAAGISDWKPFLGEYDCMHFAMTGVNQFGTVSSGVNLEVLSPNSYQAVMKNTSAPAGFSFSQMTPGIPGAPGKEVRGTLTFTAGPLAGRRALIQDYKQFQHAIIFPGKWKMANGQTDALSPGDTWCYQHNK